MKNLLLLPVGVILRLLRSRAALEAEFLALRHQIFVLERTSRRPQIRAADRLFWSWLSRIWPRWRGALVFVQPESVIAWRKRKFRKHWARLSCGPKPGRPRVPREIRELIGRISAANPLWGSPHIRGELRKQGIEVSKPTVEVIHDPAHAVSIPGVDDLSSEPLQGHGLDRFLYSPDGKIQGPAHCRGSHPLQVEGGSLLMSPSIPRPSGRRTRLWGRSLGMRPQLSFCGTVKGSTARLFKGGFAIWGSRRSSLGRDRHGRTRTSSA